MSSEAMNPLSDRPDLEELAEEAIQELVASGEFSEYSGNLPRNAKRKLRQLNLRSSDEYLLEDIFSERMITLTKNCYVEEVTDDDLNDRLLKPSHILPVMVDIYSDYCRPCNHILPIVYQLAAKFKGRLTVVKINGAKNARFVETFLSPVQLTPSFLFFKDGQPLEVNTSRAGRLLGRLLGQRASPSRTRASLEKLILSVLRDAAE
jgi:thioredoxin 1